MVNSDRECQFGGEIDGRRLWFPIADVNALIVSLALGDIGFLPAVTGSAQSRTDAGLAPRRRPRWPRNPPFPRERKRVRFKAATPPVPNCNSSSTTRKAVRPDQNHLFDSTSNAADALNLVRRDPGSLPRISDLQLFP